MAEIKRFRLLIIGKTGCGKTTILSKLCGEDVADAPSTHTAGKHNIERELDFSTNDKLVAHDSEGFEAGTESQFDVVSKFIQQRAALQDVNKRLHMVWYCVETNSRPVQSAEHRFFGEHRQVPVIAIFTKFDNFVEDLVQQLQEEAEDAGDTIPLAELDKRAAQQAEESFNDNYRSQLMDLPYPPQAVVTLSRIHESTPQDSRLAELVRQTLAALIPSDGSQMSRERRLEQEQLRELFVTAQAADLSVKVEHAIATSMRIGYGDLEKRPVDRKRLIDLWNTKWSSKDPALFNWLDSQLQKHVDFSPRLIAHPQSSDIGEVQTWAQQLRRCAQLEEIVADSVTIMRYIFLLPRPDNAVVQRVIEWYDSQSKTSKQIRQALMDTHSKNPKSNAGLKPIDLFTIINELDFEEPDAAALIVTAEEPQQPIPQVQAKKSLLSRLLSGKSGKRR